MSEEEGVFRQSVKSSNIIKSISDLYNVELREAADIYYKSELSELIEEGVADLHCRSDKYLASLIGDEYFKNISKLKA